MTKILFVCTGNICRSPMAEFILKDLAAKAGISDRLVISSAGTGGEPDGTPVYPPARRELARHGLDCRGKTARRITRADYGRYDRIIAMDRFNLRALARIWGPDREGKVSLLLSHAGRGGDVDDPWYSGDFQTAWRDILEGCQGLVRELAALPEL